MPIMPLYTDLVIAPDRKIRSDDSVTFFCVGCRCQRSFRWHRTQTLSMLGLTYVWYKCPVCGQIIIFRNDG